MLSISLSLIAESFRIIDQFELMITCNDPFLVEC